MICFETDRLPVLVLILFSPASPLKSNSHAIVSLWALGLALSTFFFSLTETGYTTRKIFRSYMMHKSVSKKVSGKTSEGLGGDNNMFFHPPMQHHLDMM